MEQQESFKHFCRICKRGFGCGRALGGHMRAHGIGGEPEHTECGGWCKGKRSRRVMKLGNANSNSNCPLSEEEDLAHCLVMLSAARVDPLVAEREESCGSASKEEEERQRNCEKAKGVARGMFQCKGCKKLFTSHQALGGHRASHKKVKGCFAAKLDDLEFSIMSKTNIFPFDNPTRDALIIPSKTESKVHECSICHRIFGSGQALGGHKRCHWVTSNSPDTSITKLHCLQDHSQLLQLRPKFDKSEPLDLNLPAPEADLALARQGRENLLHFKVTPLNFEVPKVHLQHVDDEVDSKIKVAKLSDIKDMDLGGDSSPWLQVGISSTVHGTSNP
ncbi:zinc finger protein ZAT2-like [Tasmannia lanceolata]|uniref:zinc finger protein ZAT2-like n=1 Tax=Tasmannia lanceolata TaxID=3420 RepID=UPI004064142F